MSFSERMTVVPAIALMFVLGLYPQALLVVINPTVRQMVEALKL